MAVLPIGSAGGRLNDKGVENQPELFRLRWREADALEVFFFERFAFGLNSRARSSQALSTASFFNARGCTKT